MRRQGQNPLTAWLQAVVRRVMLSDLATVLDFGAVTDGEYLRRSGSSIVSGVPGGGSGGGGTSFSKFDEHPQTADSRNEEMEAALNAAWTWQSSGGTVTNQTLGFWADTTPSNPSWNVNSDIPGALVMMPSASSQSLKAYRAFAPGTGVRWAVAAKIRLGLASGTDDRINFVLAKETTPSTSADEPTDGVIINLRGNSAGLELRCVRFAGGSAVVVDARTWFCEYAYVAFTGATDNSIRAWFSTDGMAWRLHGTLSGQAINSNVNTIWISTKDTDSGGAAKAIGIIEFVRFLASSNQLWTMGMNL